MKILSSRIPKNKNSIRDSKTKVKKKIQKKKHDDVNNIKTEYTELYLKNVLQIIYKYHNINKKILFIGIPVSFQKKLSKILKKPRHIVIPQSIWINGVLSNRFAIFSSVI
jgi:ribosomal protein S2